MLYSIASPTCSSNCFSAAGTATTLEDQLSALRQKMVPFSLCQEGLAIAVQLFFTLPANSAVRKLLARWGSKYRSIRPCQRHLISSLASSTNSKTLTSSPPLKPSPLFYPPPLAKSTQVPASSGASRRVRRLRRLRNHWPLPSSGDY